MIFGEAKGSKVLNIEKICKKKFGTKKTKEIILKTGPKKLFVCSKNENTLSLSLKAWKNLKNKKNLNHIKTLFYVTETPIKQFPGNGFLFVSKINLRDNIQVIDINSGCTGFVDALSMCLTSKKNSIIICSESYSKNNANFNRSISTLFSDGSSAFIPNLKEMKIIDSSFGYKKNSYEHLECNIEKNINMDGKKVYDFVSTDVYPALIKILKKNKNKKIDRIYIHQGSKFVVDFLKEKLKKFCNNIPTNIEKAGNFVSATIPMLISQDIKKEPFGNKENIILCGFGVGLAYSILVLEINKSKKN
jgi:3-oxoacyl-[acyl-carrier-protein] synthase-3